MSFEEPEKERLSNAGRFFQQPVLFCKVLFLRIKTGSYRANSAGGTGNSASGISDFPGGTGNFPDGTGNSAGGIDNFRRRNRPFLRGNRPFPRGFRAFPAGFRDTQKSEFSEVPIIEKIIPDSPFHVFTPNRVCYTSDSRIVFIPLYPRLRIIKL
jgi:hypothetical protein